MFFEQNCFKINKLKKTEYLQEFNESLCFFNHILIQGNDSDKV